MLRVKSRSNYSYTKPTTKRPCQPLVDKPRFAYSVEDGACCTECGWPVGRTALRSMTSDGDRAVKHFVCPSLSERARMRKELLEIA